MRDIRILPEVAEDVAAAADWYDTEGYPGLGDRFIEAFSAALPHIQEKGEIHRFVYHEFRKTILQPFPYKLFYRLHDDTWVVVLVVHAARDPATIREQLNERE